MINRLRRKSISFRTKALLTSFALQVVFIAVFASAVLFLVADRGSTALRENLAAATVGYARNAAFVFIGSLDANRIEFLSAAKGSPNIDAAFLVNQKFEIMALTDESWRLGLEALMPSGRAGEASSIVLDEPDYWLFLEPVYALDNSACTDLGEGFDACAPSRELLGYLGVIGSKSLIKSIFWKIALIVVIAALVLLALIYWVTNRLADRLYRPMMALADKTMTTANSGYREKLDYSGPREVENIAIAINHLIDRASENANELERLVAAKTQEERKAREEAEEARAFAERVKEWRTDLMAVNTHELLTPLRILIGELDRALDELRFLESGRTKEAISRRLSQMRPPIQRIEEIVEQVNIAMGIEEGRIEVRPALGMIEDVLDRIAMLYSAEVQRRNNKLAIDCTIAGPITIDHRMVETIISNLVSNSCKFTRDGEISVKAGIANEMLEIECADTGMGIPEDKKAMIFEPLYQADMSSRRAADGLGLGLSIVKGYVDRLNGRIELESADNSGTVIRIQLPIEASE